MLGHSLGDVFEDLLDHVLGDVTVDQGGSDRYLY